VKRPGREADCSPLSSAEVKEYAFMAWCSVKKKHRTNLPTSYSSPNINKVIKSMKDGTGNVSNTQMIREMNTKFKSENLKGRDHFEDVDGGIILKWALNKEYVIMWTEFMRLRTQSSGGLL